MAEAHESMQDLFETEEKPAMSLAMDGRDVPVHAIKDVQVTQGDVTSDVKLFYPEGDGPFPVLFYIHGGAFVGGFNFMDEPIIRQIVRDVKCAVISPNYQLAPAHKWPAAVNELYGLLEHFKAHAEDYHLDMDRLAVGGSSAGGNLAAVMCVKAHQEKTVRICYQLLIYPDGDLAARPEKINALTDKNMPLEALDALIDQYLPDRADVSNPLASPFLAPAKSFPQTAIFSGRRDVFWYEDREFANRLAEADINVLYKCYGGTGHGFMELAGREDVSRDVRNLACSELKRVFQEEKTV
jgi:acetyl esterase